MIAIVCVVAKEVQAHSGCGWCAEGCARAEEGERVSLRSKREGKPQRRQTESLSSAN